MRNAEVYEAIARLKARGGRGVLATVTAVRGSAPASLGAKMLVIEGEDRAHGTVGGGCVDGQVWAESRRILHEGKPRAFELDLTDREDDPDHGLICGGLVTLFLEPLVTEKLFICGAGHVGQALARFAGDLGFAVEVIDDRALFANPARFPGAALRVGPFEETLQGIAPDASASVVIVTRGHHYDELCLRWALTTRARYKGLIGSKVKISKLFARLMAEGVAVEELAAIRAPIGLHLGAVTVEEIALAAAAELVAARRLGGDDAELGRPLRAISHIASLRAALEERARAEP